MSRLYLLNHLVSCQIIIFNIINLNQDYSVFQGDTVQADRNCLNNLAVQFAKQMISPADGNGSVAFSLFC